MTRLAGLLIAVLLAQLSLPSVVHAAEDAKSTSVTVYKTEGCQCCSAWINHLRKANFTVVSHNLARKDLNALKTGNGVGRKYASCHTAKIGEYVIEGHVPAKDVQRLLATKPAGAIGLSVPGMPVGSPGMESGDTKEPYEVLLLKADGTSEVFASYHQTTE